MWVWSAVLAVWGITGLFFMAHDSARIRMYAWGTNVAGQGLWIVFGAATKQWGFIVTGIVYGVLNARNALKSRRQMIGELLRHRDAPLRDAVNEELR